MSASVAPVRRVAAAGALVLGVLAIVATVAAAGGDLLRVVLMPIVVLGVVAAAWSAVTRTGRSRWVFAALAVAGLVLVVVVVLTAEQHGVWLLVVVGLTAVSVALCRYALAPSIVAHARSRISSVRVAPAERGVLIMNPRSGGGRVMKHDLEGEARRRGIEPVVLTPGDDLLQLARDAVARSADVVGMAGGDGSQALVASVAMEAGIAFVCVPAGTRNHLALDLGLDRDDVVGALDAFGAADERRIDLATVGDRVFVNNVSLGVYAEIVQSPEYRDAKRDTTLRKLSELLGPDSGRFGIRFRSPDGTEHEGPELVLVSNNPYVLKSLGGFGTRARLDTGQLGVVAVEVQGSTDVAALVAAQSAGQVQRFTGWHEWTAAEFIVEADQPLAAGVDGEALVLDPPLVFRSLPGCLRVRVPLHASGLSPAAQRTPSGALGIVALLRTVAGKSLTDEGDEAPTT